METLAEYQARIGRGRIRFDPGVRSPTKPKTTLRPRLEPKLPIRSKRNRPFALRQGEICGDCLARSDETKTQSLDPLGNPRRHQHYGYNLAANCEGCGGTGNGTGVWVDITSALKRLTLKQKFVIERRYGLAGDGKVYTQREIAEALEITQQAVSKHENEAKKRLRDYLEGIRL